VPKEGTIAQFWTYLEDLVLDGTLEGVSLGVSNFRPQDLETVLKVARIKPVANRECAQK
jgi:diketogulonate reductase-like aldo/keto reductase